VWDCQKLELIEGELIDKMGKNRPHVNSVKLLAGWLEGVFGTRLVLPESPIDVAPEDNPNNEPEPDLIVLNRDFSHFTDANPRPEDLQLVVEVADSTFSFDRTTKAALCARASIAEYWVLDVAGAA
jgi:Uma2 family endonuclease